MYGRLKGSEVLSVDNRESSEQPVHRTESCDVSEHVDSLEQCKSVARVRLVNESKTLLKDKKFRVAGYDREAREKASMKSWSFENPFDSQWGGVFERYSNMMSLRKTSYIRGVSGGGPL